VTLRIAFCSHLVHKAGRGSLAKSVANSCSLSCSDTQRKFNLDAYSLTLVGLDGIVRGVDVPPSELEAMVESLFNSHHS
jgi:hypothetical protein